MRYAYFDSEITGVDEEGMPIFDRAENSEMFAMVFSKLIKNGVMGYPSNCFQVRASGQGLKLEVDPGFAVINGRFASEDVVTQLELEAAPKQYSRIDRVVLRCNYLDRLIELVVKKGIAGASPIPPEIIQPASGDYYELGLATIEVASNQTLLTQISITDTRMDNQCCGIITGLIDQLDTRTLGLQFQAYFNDFKQKTLIGFSEWFENIKSTLSGDVAGKLLNEINDLKEKDNDIKDSINANTSAIRDVQDAISFEAIPFQGSEPVEKKPGKKYIKKTADEQGTLMTNIGGVFKELYLKTNSSQVSHIKKDGSTTTVQSLLQDILSGSINFLKIMTDGIKSVSDCLTETTESGYYSWYMGKNQPGNHINGMIFTHKYNTDHSFRIAFTYNGLMYFSHYSRNAGQWGFWKEISFK